MLLADRYTQVFQVEKERDQAKMLHVDFFDFKKCSLAEELTSFVP